ncbi:MAG: SelB C-terminal domain-containing protein, partial [Acidobacteriota bacterium]
FFRMFIDRIFTVKGFGTVVTGTSLGGKISNEETLFLIPPVERLRIRRIEKHGEIADTITAGSRASLNLAGLEKSEYKRGMIISEIAIRPTEMIDAKIRLCARAKFSSCWLNAVFFSGTFSSDCRIHLIDKDKMETKGEEAVVQIHLKEPAVVLRGDRFIFRNSSNEITLGGGEIIDSYPLHHRRRPKKLIEQLHRLSNGGTGEFIMHELSKNRLMLPLRYFSEILFISEDRLLETLKPGLPWEILLLEKNGGKYLIHKDKIAFFEKKVLQTIESYHVRNPLDELGKTKEELMHIFKGHDTSYASILLDVILVNFLKLGLIRKEEDTFVLARHTLVMKDSVKKEIEIIENFYRRSNMRVPVESEVTDLAERYGITPEKYKQIMNYLTSKKKITCISGNYIFSETVDSCKNILLRHLYFTGRPVTVSEFRDLTNGNRKMCLLLLNYFDSLGLTQRDGDYRTITEKGKMYFENVSAEKLHIENLEEKL